MKTKPMKVDPRTRRVNRKWFVDLEFMGENQD